MIKIFKTKACNSINDISLFLSSQVSYENTHCQWFCIAHLLLFMISLALFASTVKIPAFL